MERVGFELSDCGQNGQSWTVGQLDENVEQQQADHLIEAFCDGRVWCGGGSGGVGCVVVGGVWHEMREGRRCIGCVSTLVFECALAVPRARVASRPPAK